MKTAVVALSGGLDSSVCVFLLKAQGYKVIGLTGKMVNACSADVVVQNAKAVADMLGIEHIVLDVTEEFDEKVIEYFKNSYKIGQTPNPCIVCNKFIKWGKLFDYAMNELGADIFVTGHYAKIVEQGGIYKLYPAKDVKKDQLYFLFELSQAQLAKTMFPLSDYVKDEIKQMAIDNNLPSKSSKESQDICFIQKPMTTKKFLIEEFAPQKGDFIEISTGKKLGEHQGFYQFTIGQRRGIGIAAEKPLYVVGLEPKTNTVYVGFEEETQQNSLIISEVNLHEKALPSKALVKIRYNMQAQMASVELLPDIQVKITFDEPINSITKGQAGVIYDPVDGHLIAGGWIL